MEPRKPEARTKKGKDPVADEGAKSPSPFDVRTIKDLVGLMSRHDLQEIDLRDGVVRIRLRRGPTGTSINTSPPVNAVPTAMPAPTAAAPSAPPPTRTPEEPARPARNLLDIKSPTPGTFFASPSPDAEPFVRAGSRVASNTVVCLIEAMKIFNEIQAECTGVIAEVLVENQQPVEYGQVLFRVDPAG
jgi:acetyl-CoA carboxylase biotin carboxyl carrier protein